MIKRSGQYWLASMLCMIVLCVGVLLTSCGKESPDDSSSQASHDSLVSMIESPEASQQPDEIDSESAQPLAEASTQASEAESSVTESSIAEESKENASAASEKTGSLQVQGTQLTDEAGNPIVLRGISTHGLSWFPEYVNADAFRYFRENWNCNCIRLAMYTAEYNGYCTGDEANRENLKRLIDEGVRCATEQNLYVIIDWHILSDGNPNTYKEQAISFFDEMAEKYQDQSNVLYEICNEPNGGTSWSEIKAYAEEIIPVIRKHDADAVILVGTPNWCQFVEDAAADPITGYENIMYTLHFYAATHTDSLRNQMVSVIDQGLPIFVSEFGICDASGSGGIDENQAAQWIRLMDEYGVSRMVWNLSNKAETSALISGDCSKTSNWTYEELSSSGKWIFDHMFQGDISSIPVESPAAAEPQSQLSNSVEAPASMTGEEEAALSDEALEYAAYTLKENGRWESEGHTYVLYEVTIHNTTDKACTGWMTEISLEQAVTLSDSWNGNFEVDGNVVRIKNADYNGAISAGGQAAGIGFIVYW